MKRAAIITVGSELVEGLRVDTNTAEIARALAPNGLAVVEAVSVGDDEVVLAETIVRLIYTCDLVVVTGGLGPTHDDITREAASRALGLQLVADSSLLARLQPLLQRHREAGATDHVLSQALVLDGGRIISPTTGTAAGQMVKVGHSVLALLPGPPNEMRAMLPEVVASFSRVRAQPQELGVVGLAESDVQLAAQRALAARPGVTLTVLAKPGDVRVILLDSGAGAAGLAAAAHDVCRELGDHCYSAGGSSLAEEVLRSAGASGLTLATAESCTGGLVAAALTDVPGSSASFLGGVVSYSDSVKSSALGVDPDLLQRFGAVSEQVAAAMAEGVRTRMNADLAVSVTGIAGPDGGSVEKPVGLVWFSVASAAGAVTHEARFTGGSRDSVRARATATALDLLRRAAIGR